MAAELCGVCLGDAAADAAALLQCVGGCERRAHAACLGASEPWRCAVCENAANGGPPPEMAEAGDAAAAEGPAAKRRRAARADAAPPPALMAERCALCPCLVPGAVMTKQSISPANQEASVAAAAAAAAASTEVATGAEGWAHLCCVKALGGAQASADGLKTEARACRLCGASGRGVAACAGGCGTASFHLTCALLRGFGAGYARGRCPACCSAAARDAQCRAFATAAQQTLATPPEPHAAALVERLRSGAFARSAFAAAIPVLSLVEQRGDPRLMQTLSLLEARAGEASESDSAALAAAVVRLRKERLRGGLAPPAQKIYGSLVPRDREAELAKRAASDDDSAAAPASRAAREKALLLKRRQRRLLAGFMDSVYLLVDLVALAAAAAAAPESAASAVAAVVHSVAVASAKAVQDLEEAEATRAEQLAAVRDGRLRGAASVSATSLRLGMPRVEPGGAKRSKLAMRKGRGGGGGGGAEQAAQKEQEAAEREDQLGEVRRQPGPLPASLADALPRLRAALHTNAQQEPYLHGAWRKQPYARRPYEHLEGDYALPRGSEAIEEHLVARARLSDAPPACPGGEVCAKPYRFDLRRGTFADAPPCLTARAACEASALGRGEGLRLNHDLVEANMWGLDCFARSNVQAALRVLCGLKDDDPHQLLIVQGLFLPTVGAQPAYRAFHLNFSMLSILKAVRKPAGPDGAFQAVCGEYEDDYEQEEPGDTTTAVALIVQGVLRKLGEADPELVGEPGVRLVRLAAAAVLYLVRAEGPSYFRIHPKGVGVQSRVREGIRAGAFITKYLGELYTPPRWFEKQDAIKNVQRRLRIKPVLPEFYNIVMERPDSDSHGYEILYVDPVVRGNFASRLSHSCDPNCVTVVMSSPHDGLCVALFALRDIAFGEELCFDYSSVTEDENEFLTATCLCASLRCRGSFLYYAGLGAFADVINDLHGFLQRNAVLYHACARGSAPLDDAELAVLRSNGIGAVVVDELPVWMARWMALVLGFAEEERRELSHRLQLKTHMLTGKLLYDKEAAELEAIGVKENRRQNVFITMRKLCYFLAKGICKEQGKEPTPEALRQVKDLHMPIHPLTSAQVADFLWNGDESVAAVAIGRLLDRHASDANLPLLLQLHHFQSKAAGNPLTEAEARRAIRDLRDVVYTMAPPSDRSPLAAAGDLLTMWLHTRHLFTSEGYPGCPAKWIDLKNADIGHDGSGADADTAAGGGGGGGGKKAKKSKKAAPLAQGDQGDQLATPTALKALPFWVHLRSEHIELGPADRAKLRAMLVMGETAEHLELGAAAGALLPDRPLGDQVAVFVEPMPRATAYYLFTAQPGGPGAPVAPMRVAKDEPLRPMGGDNPQQWKLSGLIFAFEHPFPGTRRVNAFGPAGEPVALFAFPAATLTTGRVEPRDPEELAALRRLPRDPSPLESAFKPSETAARLADKKYQSGFVWGQMVGWYKQTVATPDASLSAERRGSMSLPDIGSCFSGQAYTDRAAILERIENSPNAMWPTGTHWTFRNKHKVYGSPWLDEAIDPTCCNSMDVVATMRHHQATRAPPPRAPDAAPIVPGVGGLPPDPSAPATRPAGAAKAAPAASRSSGRAKRSKAASS